MQPHTAISFANANLNTRSEAARRGGKSRKKVSRGQKTLSGRHSAEREMRFSHLIDCWRRSELEREPHCQIIFNQRDQSRVDERLLLKPPPPPCASNIWMLIHCSHGFQFKMVRWCKWWNMALLLKSCRKDEEGVRRRRRRNKKKSGAKHGSFRGNEMRMHRDTRVSQSRMISRAKSRNKLNQM